MSHAACPESCHLAPSHRRRLAAARAVTAVQPPEREPLLFVALVLAAGVMVFGAIKAGHEYKIAAPIFDAGVDSNR